MTISSTRKCFNEAIAVISRLSDDEIAPDERTHLVDTLRSVMESAGENEEMLLSRMAAAAEDAGNDLFRFKYSKRFQDFKDANELNPTFLEGDPVKASNLFRRWVDPLIGNRGQGVQSYLAQVEGETRTLLGKINDVIAALVDVPTGRALRASDLDEPFVRSMLGLEVDNPDVAKMVARVRDALEPYLTRLRKAGVWIDEQPNWWGRDYDLGRINGNRTRFRELLRAGLDRENHPDPDATIEAMLSKLSRRDAVGSDNLGMGMRRKLQFSDPEIEFLVYKEFGTGSAGQMLFRFANALVQETAAVERFGPLWRQRLPELGKAITTRVQEKVRTGAQATSSKARERAARRQAREVARASRNVDHAVAVMSSRNTDLTRAGHITTAKITQLLQNYIAFAKLGKTVFWQVTIDPFFATMQGAILGGNVARSFARQTRIAAQLATSKEWREMARYYGVWRDGLLIQSNARMPAIIDPASQFNLTASPTGRVDRQLGRSAQAAAWTQRVSLSNMLENWDRSANMMANMTFLADIRNLPWERLNPRARQWAFENNGVTKQDWERLRTLEPNRYGMIDLDALEAAHPDTFRRVAAMLHRESQQAVVRSDVSDRVFLTMAAPPGARLNAVVSTLTQFWAWNTRAIRGPLARAWHMGTPAYVAMSAGLIIATATGMQMRALVTGRKPFDPTDMNFWWRATVQSGVLGPWAPDAVSTVSNVTGRSSSVPGAVPSTLAKVTGDTLGTAFGIVEGDVEAGAGVLMLGSRTALEATPNLWQIDWFLQAVYNEIEWELDPERAKRRERFREEGRIE